MKKGLGLGTNWGQQEQGSWGMGKLGGEQGTGLGSAGTRLETKWDSKIILSLGSKSGTQKWLILDEKLVGRRVSVWYSKLRRQGQNLNAEKVWQACASSKLRKIYF